MKEGRKIDRLTVRAPPVADAVIGLVCHGRRSRKAEGGRARNSVSAMCMRAHSARRRSAMLPLRRNEPPRRAKGSKNVPATPGLKRNTTMSLASHAAHAGPLLMYGFKNSDDVTGSMKANAGGAAAPAPARPSRERNDVHPCIRHEPNSRRCPRIAVRPVWCRHPSRQPERRRDLFLHPTGGIDDPHPARSISPCAGRPRPSTVSSGPPTRDGRKFRRKT